MQIPKNEKPMTDYATVDGVIDHVATQHLITGKFALYKIVEDGYERLKVDTTPMGFDDIIKKNRRG
jgi:hypothetical protein